MTWVLSAELCWMLLSDNVERPSLRFCGLILIATSINIKWWKNLLAGVFSVVSISNFTWVVVDSRTLRRKINFRVPSPVCRITVSYYSRFMEASIIRCYPASLRTFPCSNPMIVSVAFGLSGSAARKCKWNWRSADLRSKCGAGYGVAFVKNTRNRGHES